jgi:hypothetical protein
MVKNFADAARLSEHAPDFCGYRVKIEIRSRPQAQDDDAAVNISRRRFFVLNKDAIDCDTQCCGTPLLRGDDETQRVSCIRYVCTPRLPIRLVRAMAIRIIGTNGTGRLEISGLTRQG